MYSSAPRCSDAVSPRSVPEGCRLPPLEAKALAETSRPAAKVASFFTMGIFRTERLCASGLWAMRSVMHLHPFRHRLGSIQLGPDRHGDEEGEVQEGQHLADLGLDRVGTRAGADLAQPQEADGQDGKHHLGDP